MQYTKVFKLIFLVFSLYLRLFYKELKGYYISIYSSIEIIKTRYLLSLSYF